MSDLMNTKNVKVIKNKCSDGGLIEHNEYTLDQSKYVAVKEPNGKVITGNKAIESDDTFLNW